MLSANVSDFLFAFPFENGYGSFEPREYHFLHRTKSERQRMHLWWLKDGKTGWWMNKHWLDGGMDRLLPISFVEKIWMDGWTLLLDLSIAWLAFGFVAVGSYYHLTPARGLLCSICPPLVVDYIYLASLDLDTTHLCVALRLRWRESAHASPEGWKERRGWRKQPEILRAACSACMPACLAWLGLACWVVNTWWPFCLYIADVPALKKHSERFCWWMELNRKSKSNQIKSNQK